MQRRLFCQTIGSMKNIEEYMVTRRREPYSIERLIEYCIRDLKLETGLNDRRIFAAWDKASGAAEYTMDRYFRNGTLCCSISSSVVRSMLTVRRPQIVKDMTDILRTEEGEISGKGKMLEVKKLILR